MSYTTVFTLPQIIGRLDSGEHWTLPIVTYSFPTSAPAYSLTVDTPDGFSFSPLVASQQAMVRTALALFALLLAGLPVLAGLGQGFALADSFYRAGSLVFGGGHVVLPLLQEETVTPGWVSEDVFLAGYGAAQAVPGPLFTFAAWLGTVMGPKPNGVAGAAIALLALFLPGFLILIAAVPFWDRFRRKAWAQSAMLGANAAVVGILGAALYSPVFTSAIGGIPDFALALTCFVALVAWKAPPWAVVLLVAAGGVVLG